MIQLSTSFSFSSPKGMDKQSSFLGRLLKINIPNENNSNQQKTYSTSTKQQQNNSSTITATNNPTSTHTPTLSPESPIKLYHFHYRIKPSQGGIIKRFMNGREGNSTTKKETESSAVVRVISFTESANYAGMG